MTLLDKALVAMGDLLRLKIWSKTKLSYVVDQFIVNSVYRLLNDFMARDYFFTETWFTPYLTMDKHETFIDVGANVGYYTTRMAKRAGHVFAFEPNPEVYKLLKSKTQGSPNVTCFPYALGKGEKQVKLYAEAHAIFDKKRSAGSSIERGSLNYTSVQCFALDDLVKKTPISKHKIGLMKIDVEGAEYEVLHGAKGVLASFHPRLLIEIHGKDNFVNCIRFLKELRYTVHVVKEYKSWNLWWLIAEYEVKR